MDNLCGPTAEDLLFNGLVTNIDENLLYDENGKGDMELLGNIDRFLTVLCRYHIRLLASISEEE